MWFLRLLIYVVSNILLSIKPIKRHSRGKSKTVKSERRLGAKDPIKVDFPATGTFEADTADTAPLDKTVSPVILDIKEHNPESSSGGLVTEAPGEVSEEIVVKTQVNLTELHVQNDMLPFTIKDNAIPIAQDKAAILPPYFCCLHWDQRKAGSGIETGTVAIA